MEDNISNLKKGSSLQGGRYVIEKTLGNGNGTEDDTILSVIDDKGEINGHEYVDLGLSVKWATCNVGASSPTDCGNYYAWDETGAMKELTRNNAKTYSKSFGDIGDNSTYEPARAIWGGSWRLPTNDEFKELIDNCEIEWTTQGGIDGLRFTSDKNGNSIFLPAAGWRYRSTLDGAGEFGGYWSATPYEGGTGRAHDLWFFGSGQVVVWGSRNLGRSVRPVSD